MTGDLNFKTLMTHIKSLTNFFTMHGIDIENAFLESDLEETIYMKLPVGTYSEANGKPVIVRLKKSLYGLKQAVELLSHYSTNS